MSATDEMTNREGSKGRRTSIAVFGGALVAVAALKITTLDDPAAGDAASGLFPAAATLAANGFDLGALLDQPGYSDGGPNVHPLSPVTLITAVVLLTLGGTGIALPTLHILHFLVTAIAATGVYRVARIALPNRLAVAATTAGMTVPLVTAQRVSCIWRCPCSRRRHGRWPHGSKDGWAARSRWRCSRCW